MTSSVARLRLGLAPLAVVAALVLAGCTSGPDPVKTDDAGAENSGATANPEATLVPDPIFVPEGTATDNLPYFSKVVADTWAAGGGVTRESYIEAMKAAGFDPAAMEATASITTINNAVESFQISVLWQGECLIGQVGAETPQPVSVVMPALADGGCLIGQTPPVG